MNREPPSKYERPTLSTEEKVRRIKAMQNGDEVLFNDRKKPATVVGTDEEVLRLRGVKLKSPDQGKAGRTVYICLSHEGERWCRDSGPVTRPLDWVMNLTAERHSDPSPR